MRGTRVPPETSAAIDGDRLLPYRCRGVMAWCSARRELIGACPEYGTAVREGGETVGEWEELA